MINELFQSFADQLITAKTESELREAMSAVAAALGFDKFAYFHAAPGRPTPLMIITYPEAWIARYVSADYGRVDPVLLRSRTSVTPFEWGTEAFRSRLTPEQAAFMDEAASFGIRYGYTVPIWDSRNPIACVHLAASEPAQGAATAVREQQLMLRLMGILFHSHVERKLLTPRSGHAVQLSGREIACLKWLAQGRTVAEIGEALEASEEEIRFHIENAQRKLGALSPIEALVKSATDGHVQVYS